MISPARNQQHRIPTTLQRIRKDHRGYPNPEPAGNVNPSSCHDPEQLCCVHSGQRTEIPTIGKGLVWESTKYLQKIHNVRSHFKMLSLWGREAFSTSSYSVLLSCHFSFLVPDIFSFLTDIIHFILNIQPISHNLPFPTCFGGWLC